MSDDEIGKIKSTDLPAGDQEKFLQSDDEKQIAQDSEKKEIVDLIQSQMGKTVDVDMDSMRFGDQEILERIQEESGIEGRYDDAHTEVEFVNENLDRITNQLPGIMQYFHSTIRRSADTESRGISIAIRPLRTICDFESPGTTLLNKVNGLYGVSAYTEVSEDDWAQSLVLAKKFPEQFQEKVAGIIAGTENYIATVSDLISSYQSERRPSAQECLDGGSISEPVLQFLIGGSTHEGLSRIVQYLGKPTDLQIGDQVISEQGFSAKLKIRFGNLDLMKEGAEVSMDYLRFISKIFEECPECRAQGRVTDLEGTVQKYLNEEWQRREQAIEIAQKIKDFLIKKLEFYKSLIQSQSESEITQENKDEIIDNTTVLNEQDSPEKITTEREQEDFEELTARAIEKLRQLGPEVEDLTKELTDYGMQIYGNPGFLTAGYLVWRPLVMAEYLYGVEKPRGTFIGEPSIKDFSILEVGGYSAMEGGWISSQPYQGAVNYTGIDMDPVDEHGKLKAWEKEDWHNRSSEKVLEFLKMDVLDIPKELVDRKYDFVFGMGFLGDPMRLANDPDGPAILEEKVLVSLSEVLRDGAIIYFRNREPASISLDKIKELGFDIVEFKSGLTQEWILRKIPTGISK